MHCLKKKLLEILKLTDYAFVQGSLFFDKNDDFANRNEEIFQPYHQESFKNNQWHVSSAF